MSLAGCDREPVRKLCRELEKDLSVFIDEDGLGYFASISAGLEQALRSSKTLVAYYSAAYAVRPACQWELTSAFLAGQREGNPAGRIIVINPEEETDHILPVEVADARFALAPTTAEEVRRLADRIRSWVAAISGHIGDVPFHDRPRWYGRPPGQAGFHGRYREQWLLHSALHGSDLAITEPTCGPVAAVAGAAGMGKTSLVAAYAWQYGAAFRGGVHWLRLTGATERDALARYAVELRAIADMLGLDYAGADQSRLSHILAEYLAARPEPSLWVIDDVPPDLAPEVADQLLIPAEQRIRTVLISRSLAYGLTTRENPYGRAVTSIEVGPLTSADGRLLLSGYRPATDSGEVEALDRIVGRLGGNAYAAALAGLELRDQQGLISYQDYADRLMTDHTVPEPVTAMFHDAVLALDDTQRLIIEVALTVAPAPLPARLIDSAARSLRPEATVATALEGLRRRLLATRTGSSWQIHPLVLDAARRYLQPLQSQAELAMARALTTLAAETDRSELLPHADVLAGRAELPAELTEALLRLLADHYESCGEAVSSARYRDRLIEGRPDDPDLALAAARAHYEAGAYDMAIARATRVRGRQALLIHAASLDALGRFAEAEPYWADLLSAPPELATGLAHLRGLRLRGRLRDAEREARNLLARHAVEADGLQQARLELARVRLALGDSPGARALAESVIGHYRDLDLPHHSRCSEAQEVLAEALLTPHLTDLRPDHSGWERAERSLRRLGDEYRRSHGEYHLVTLGAAVGLGYALVSRGEPERGRAELTRTIALLRRHAGNRHPLLLRAMFLLGQTFEQTGDWESARGLFAQALDGQLAVLGPGHPHTAETRQEYGVALKLTGDTRAAAQMFAASRRAAADAVGRFTDLYMRAGISTALVHLPTWMWRKLGE
ncbi:hypothetical protein GCM10009555_003180 [Acrocarpospora macrocephala]|uniref:TIR domain-containing protein n=1 Tax=Acrocarpospora macrocephala TaxID=150177 RepID=A0A5M3X6K1_9ACTN|nr:tetratricopeptide repeat protein [Acrocarpospora macrocephala]GES15311.1 hypothetical protein Amac_089080 [Acrocarpospora macrocephala]